VPPRPRNSFNIVRNIMPGVGSFGGRVISPPVFNPHPVPVAPVAPKIVTPPAPQPLPVNNAPYADLPRPAVLMRQDPKQALYGLCAGFSHESLPQQVMTAAASGNASALGKLLARPDVLPDFCNFDGVTPLMAAAGRGHTAVVEMLAAHPLVNVGRQDEKGWTALHYAAALRNDGAAAALLKHRAPPEAQTADGKTALDIAAGAAVEETFWQSRNFRRHMETVDRCHPRLLGGKSAKPKPPGL
jgi:hypothetical protein